MAVAAAVALLAGVVLAPLVSPGSVPAMSGPALSAPSFFAALVLMRQKNASKNREHERSSPRPSTAQRSIDPLRTGTRDRDSDSYL